jgi:hypothetical protein
MWIGSHPSPTTRRAFCADTPKHSLVGVEPRARAVDAWTMQAIIRPAVVAAVETLVVGLFLLAIGAARVAQLVGSLQADRPFGA